MHENGRNHPWTEPDSQSPLQPQADAESSDQAGANGSEPVVESTDAESPEHPSHTVERATNVPQPRTEIGTSPVTEDDGTETDTERTVGDETWVSTEHSSDPGIPDQGTGNVSLIGAGPGDPGLLTRRAWDRLQGADVVLHDSLTGDAILEDLPAAVEVIDVGKRPPNRTSQEEINQLMCNCAARGERVVRLKGGDPNVFGRGGEEAEYLASEGVPFEIVAGVSSVLAAAGVSAIPLTHRDCSSSLTVITGHQTPDKDESAIDWPAIANTITAGGTLVVLMGVSRLPENVDALRAHGVPADTPVAMVEKATWDEERVVSGTLDDIVDTSRDVEIEPPAVTIVGEVVDVHDAVCDYHRR